MGPITCEELARLPVLKKFYSVAQRLFGVAIAFLKPDSKEGVLLGPAGELNPFCELLDSNPEGHKLCMNCDFAHQQEAKHLKRSIQYVCHAGLIDFVIPVSYGSTIIAYVQCGQILGKQPERKDWARLRAKFQGLNIDMKKLRQYYFQTRVIDADMRESLIELLEIFSNYIADSGSRLLMLEKDRKSQIVFLAESFIKAHFHEHISLDDVAREAHTSKRNLTRVFAAETSTTVLDSINKMRILRACELLAGNTEKVSAVAFACGFGSIQQFNRLFRLAMGASPHEWRKSSQVPPTNPALVGMDSQRGRMNQKQKPVSHQTRARTRPRARTMRDTAASLHV